MISIHHHQVSEITPGDLPVWRFYFVSFGPGGEYRDSHEDA
jgi:hypothetical protein